MIPKESPNWTQKKEKDHGEEKERSRRTQGWQQGRQQVQRVVTQFADSAALCRHVRAESGDTCLLAFSAGKDAVCAWIQARRYFGRVVPLYRYLVPGLEFVEDGLAYYERAFGTPIYRVPHPSIYRMLNNLVFQPPERCAAIERARLPRITYAQTNDHVRQVANATGAWVANGTRTADSPIRLMSVRKHGPRNMRERGFMAVYDWRIADVEREIKAAGLKLTVDYQMFGRSFDGIDYRFLKPIKERFPRDYQRILEWFPLADLELFRRERIAA